VSKFPTFGPSRLPSFFAFEKRIEINGHSK
jgi:hypothetical protein